jgi:hypothetical protein
MINSIAVCGRTLLETVQHLLDHAERNETDANHSVKTFPDEHTICISSEAPIPPMTSISGKTVSFCNIGLTCEEVIEAIYLGEGRFDVSIGGDDSVTQVGPEQASVNTIAHRRSRFIIVNIADHVCNA